MLITFDEELRPLPVSVRVGQAVDVVGQAGKPKTITGFQTHTTPVLLAHGERAELATEDYVSLTPIMEGFVILQKKVEWKSSRFFPFIIFFCFLKIISFSVFSSFLSVSLYWASFLFLPHLLS